MNILMELVNSYTVVYYAFISCRHQDKMDRKKKKERIEKEMNPRDSISWSCVGLRLSWYFNFPQKQPHWSLVTTNMK